MNELHPRKPRGPCKYNQRFCAALKNALSDNHSIHSLSRSLDDMSPQYRDLFFGCDKRSVQREFWRWRDKLSNSDARVEGTIRNLEILCELTKSTPNEVLLTLEERQKIDKGRNADTQYLSRKTIKSFLTYLHDGKELSMNEYRLPVRFSSDYFFFVFLVVYTDKKRANEILAEFIINYWYPTYKSHENNNNGFQTAYITSPFAVRREKWKPTLNQYLSPNTVSTHYETQRWQEKLEVFLDDAYKNIDDFLRDEIDVEGNIECLHEEFFFTIAGEQDTLFDKLLSKDNTLSQTKEKILFW